MHRDTASTVLFHAATIATIIALGCVYCRCEETTNAAMGTYVFVIHTANNTPSIVSIEHKDISLIVVSSNRYYIGLNSKSLIEHLLIAFDMITD